MAVEKRQLELNIVATAKTAAGTAQAARDLDKVGTAADAAGRKVDSLGKATTSADRDTEKFGRQAKNTAGKVDDLNDEIRNVNRELVVLAAAFHAAGDASEKLDISKAIRRTENDLRRITKSRDLLKGSILPEVNAADVGKWTAKLRDLIGSNIASAPVLTGAAILGLGVLPTIAGSISGAVVGGVGIGGIIGGMALAAKQPAISGYAKRIGADFSANVNASAKSVFTGPIMDSLNQLEALAARSAPKIGQIFKNSAPGVNVLTQAIGRSADALLDSAVTASGKSGPAMAAFGRLIQGTSESIADFITMLADHSEEGADAIDDLTQALTWMVHGITDVIEGLITFSGWIHSTMDAVEKGKFWLEDHTFALDATADGYKKGSAAAKLYRDGIIGAAGSINDYSHYLKGSTEGTDKLADAQTNAAKAASGHRDALVGLSNEMRAEADPVFGLINAQDKLAEAQKNVAEATRKHGKNSDETKKALRDLAMAAIDLQGKAGGLSGTFNGQLTPAMRNTLRAAGLTEDEIAGVATQFRAAKRAGDAYAKTYRAKVITDYINKYSNVVSSAAQDSYEKTKREINKRAAGGPASRGVPYMVGEHGPEIVVPNAAGRVLSAAATRGMASVGSGGGGASWPAEGITARIELVGQEQMRTVFRYMIRSMNLLQAA